MKNHRLFAAGALLGAAVLSGCASPRYSPPVSSQPYPPVQTYPASSPSYGYGVGTVESIQLVQGGGSNGIGTGAVVGGVVGGLLGNQVGGGRGKKAATVAGVVGGAMIGHQMEQNTQARNAYQITVRMDNGGVRTIQQDSVTDLQVGNRVRVENDRVYRY